MIENKPIFNKKAYNKGLCFINDIIHNDGHFIPHQEVVNRFGQSITQYEYMSLIDAIPIAWRMTLRRYPIVNIQPSSEPLQININNTNIEVSILKSKQVYDHLNALHIEKPPCIHKWFEKYYIDFNTCRWKNIFGLARTLSKNSKIIAMQFKIIHRAYASNSYVSILTKQLINFAFYARFLTTLSICSLNAGMSGKILSYGYNRKQKLNLY